MKLTNLPSEFQKALPILEKIKSAGFEAYFVGGSVRDILLGREIHDVDIATSSYPEETKQIFPHTADIGIEHGTVLVLEEDGEYEVTTFRTEDVYVDYRRPSSVSFVRSLEEDLKRRDFTVNAFALDETGQVFDLFDGISDLKNQILRAVGKAEERFNEDALRIMRGLRFAASLNFVIEAETFKAMSTHAPLLEKISVERSFIEFDKLLMAPYWRVGIEQLKASGAYDYLPDLSGTFAKWQSFLDNYDENFVFFSSEQAWAAMILALEIDNPQTFLKKWKTSVNFQKSVQNMVRLYQLRLSRDFTKREVYTYGKVMLEEVEQLREAQGLPVDFYLIVELDADLSISDKSEIVVNGKLLITEHGYQPGPELGQTLKEVEWAIVDGYLANDKEAILAYLAER